MGEPSLIVRDFASLHCLVNSSLSSGTDAARAEGNIVFRLVQSFLGAEGS
jgi:hypothetical protein